jgi:hypothetical protein
VAHTPICELVHMQWYATGFRVGPVLNRPNPRRYG